VSCELLGPCGGVDDDSLACACWSYEHARALGACQDEQRVALLVCEWCTDALCDLPHRIRPRRMSDVSSGGTSQRGGSPFDRLLPCAHLKSRHAVSLQSEDAPVTNHSASDIQCFVRCQDAGGLLQRDLVQITYLEHRFMLG
jgi:hypothetical protein